MTILETLTKRKNHVEKELNALIKLHDVPCLSRGFKALERSNKALMRYIKDENDLQSRKWAEAWDKLKKKYVEICKKQDHIGYSDKRVKLEVEFRQLNNEIYRLSR